MNDETRQGDNELDGQTFKINTFSGIIDRLYVKLRKRITAYEKVCENYDFFLILLS